jgi:UDP-N-acetylglucosamine 4-epimerase
MQSPWLWHGDNPATVSQAYNVAFNGRIRLNALFAMTRAFLIERYPRLRHYAPHYAEFRSGDGCHSQADISKAAALFGHAPMHDIARGLQGAIGWYPSHPATAPA